MADLSLGRGLAGSAEGIDTYEGVENLTGTRDGIGDVLIEDDQDNFFFGLGGSDVLRGNTGNDTLVSHWSLDHLYGG